MNEVDFRRLSDIVASRTEQKLDDLIRRYEEGQQESKEWREKFVSRLEPLEKLNEKLKTPLQVFFWVCTAFFGAAGIAIWRWLETHWK